MRLPMSTTFIACYKPQQSSKNLRNKCAEVILRNENILQEAVDSLIDNSIRHGSSSSGGGPASPTTKVACSNLKGKRGLFRQNLLGKRVDYSAVGNRIGFELKIESMRASKHMALELFRPFVISN